MGRKRVTFVDAPGFVFAPRGPPPLPPATRAELYDALGVEWKNATCAISAGEWAALNKSHIEIERLSAAIGVDARTYVSAREFKTASEMNDERLRVSWTLGYSCKFIGKYKPQDPGEADGLVNFGKWKYVY